MHFVFHYIIHSLGFYAVHCKNLSLLLFCSWKINATPTGSKQATRKSSFKNRLSETDEDIQMIPRPSPKPIMEKVGWFGSSQSKNVDVNPRIISCKKLCVHFWYDYDGKTQSTTSHGKLNWFGNHGARNLEVNPMIISCKNMCKH